MTWELTRGRRVRRAQASGWGARMDAVVVGAVVLPLSAVAQFVFLGALHLLRHGAWPGPGSPTAGVGVFPGQIELAWMSLAIAQIAPALLAIALLYRACARRVTSRVSASSALVACFASYCAMGLFIALRRHHLLLIWLDL